ncbi:hypothetical protein L7Q45_000221 [Citrobacter braakii]|jgi:hypothetical protein|nr:hypothetical protein [Citrobacter braakii]KHE12787.1 hypothetical protein LH87_23785 [Citrobacter braakii]MRE81729.1 hypothetical protein [Citrobacter braakii]
MVQMAKRFNAVGVIAECFNLLSGVSRLIQKEFALLLSFEVVRVSYAPDFIGADADFLSSLCCRVIMLFNHRQRDSVMDSYPQLDTMKYE